jgi:hypothetical protein
VRIIRPQLSWSRRTGFKKDILAARRIVADRVRTTASIFIVATQLLSHYYLLLQTLLSFSH